MVKFASSTALSLEILLLKTSASATPALMFLLTEDAQGCGAFRLDPAHLVDGLPPFDLTAAMVPLISPAGAGLGDGLHKTSFGGPSNQTGSFLLPFTSLNYALQRSVASHSKLQAEGRVTAWLIHGNYLEAVLVSQLLLRRDPLVV